MDDSRAAPPDPKPAWAPAYLLVLLLAALAGVFLMHRAAGVWAQAIENEAFPAGIRRQLAFALLFNAGLAGALALAIVGEIVGAIARLRRHPADTGDEFEPTWVTAVLRLRRALGRLVLALGVPAVFLAGHALVNPWVGDVLRALRAAMGV